MNYLYLRIALPSLVFLLVVLKSHAGKDQPVVEKISAVLRLDSIIKTMSKLMKN